jgi:hypothetical protein
LWLLDKEWRDLLASRAWWVFLILFAPLVGVSFSNAVRTYAEASGLNGSAAGAGEAFSPLIGIWAPTFSACELAAAFLLPFVAIRLVAGDRQSGAQKLEMQHPMSALTRIAVKAFVLLSAWLIACLIPTSAVLLWRSYGGSIYWPELATVVFGHMLNAGLTISLAGAAASIAEHPATAAILTLAVTVGSWIINFVAAVHGGAWARVAAYTPTAMVNDFQHGLIALDVVLIAVMLIVTGLGLAALWMRDGVPVRLRVYESMTLSIIAAVAIASCTLVNKSWDASENRMNSFSRNDEQVLRAIHVPLRMEVHLAPEDPRRVDLEHRALSKLGRVMPSLKVEYISATSIGLFEQTSPHYGEIWYELNGQKTVSRVTTPEGVLENIYSLAGVKPPEDDEVFPGHPLAVPPKRAALVFYVFWPALSAGIGFFLHRRQS